jgi:hypothetical protein
MIASQQIAPPGQFSPQGIGEPVIGVRIMVSPDAVTTPYLYPENNRVGTEMLCRLLEARMELAGVRVTEPSHSLAFNWSAYAFTVSELGAALNAIKEELGKLGLLLQAHIAWRDPREEVWRVWHSKSNWFEMPSDEAFAAETKLRAAVIDAGKAILQSEDESPCQ